MKEEDGFEFLLLKLDANTSKKLNETRNKLKYKVTTSQRMDSQIASTIEIQLSTISAVLSEIYPEKKDASYSNEGFYAKKNKRSKGSGILDFEF